MNWNPSSTVSLAKGNAHVLKTKLLKGWQYRCCCCNDYVGVIGSDDERLASFSHVHIFEYLLLLIAWDHNIFLLLMVSPFVTMVVRGC